MLNDILKNELPQEEPETGMPFNEVETRKVRVVVDGQFPYYQEVEPEMSTSRLQSDPVRVVANLLSS